MAILLKVKWIEKSEQIELHQRIRHIGGDSGEFTWKHSHADAIRFIEHRQFEYYVESPRPVRLDVARTADGKKYLAAQTESGPLQLDLPQFPAPDSQS